MSMARAWAVATIACVVALVAGGSAQATLLATGPYGAGGTLNAYERNGTAMTWDAARVAAASRSFVGVAGHLVTLGSAAENAFVFGVGSGDRWIGLTDSFATSTIDGATMPGVGEFGNTSGMAYPVAGTDPNDNIINPGTQRGEGWAWVTGEPLVYQNWGGGEPNNSGEEDAAHIRGDAGWNDHRAGSTLGNTDQNLASLIEYDVNLTGGVLLHALNYREVKANTGVIGQITNLAQGEALLALNPGDPGHAGEKSGLATVVNLRGGGGEGRFGNNDSYLIGGDDFASEFTGWIRIPSAGQWTFGTNSDDGTGLVIGTFTKNNDVLAGPHDHLATFNFASAGMYPLRLVFFERGGGEEVELFAAQGAFTSYNTNFRLVGDRANGGLVVTNMAPEPATLALLGLGALALARRRRRP